MTYISAFRCRGGIVMCADTQETIRDTKNYVEKIEIVEDLSYPLAVGGAGAEDIIKPITQEIIDRVTSLKPPTQGELRKIIRDSVREVFEKDVPILALNKQYRAPQVLIAAKPTTDDFCIFPVVGRRTYKDVSKAIIGYPTAYNYALLERLYRSDLPMQQAVVSAIYLASQSKQFDEGVGGDSRVVIVRENGAWIDDPEYITKSEVYIAEFLKLIDSLFLDCVDVSIAPSQFLKKLREFTDKATSQRQTFADYSSIRSFQRQFDPGFKGDPYSKLFLGAVQEFTVEGFKPVREETTEEIERRRKMIEDTQRAANTIEASRKMAELTQGKRFTGIFDVPISVRGGAFSKE